MAEQEKQKTLIVCCMNCKHFAMHNIRCMIWACPNCGRLITAEEIYRSFGGNIPKWEREN